MTGGTSLYVVDGEDAYSIPIESNGGAGTVVGSLGFNPTDTPLLAGIVAKGPGDLCAIQSLDMGGARQINCAAGGDVGFGEELELSALALPSCVVAFVEYIPGSWAAGYFVSNRDRAPQVDIEFPMFALPQNDLEPIATDGPNLYFVDASGLRVLPIP